jgi:hypothetical protein
MLDTDPSRYQHTPDNGVAIPEWDGNADDDTLVELVKFFTSMSLDSLYGGGKRLTLHNWSAVLATTGTEDVRPVLHYYQGKDVVETFKANQAALRAAEAAQQEAVRKLETEKSKSVWSWLSMGKH